MSLISSLKSFGSSLGNNLISSGLSGLNNMLFGKSGQQRASNSAAYNAYLFNQYLQNPAAATKKFSKNSDLNNEQFQSWVNSQTGAHLTGAQNEQNQFNADQAQLQRDWEEQMSNTAHQRSVADMQAAGLNPAMMYGNGDSPASTPSGASASGSAGAGIGSAIGALSGLMQLALEERKVKNESSLALSQSAVNYAQAALLGSQKVTEDNRPGLIHQQIKESLANVTNLLEQAKTEEEKRKLLHEQQFLTRAQTLTEDQLRNVREALLNAQANQSNAEAQLKAVSALYQNKLIDAGQIEAAVAETRSQIAKNYSDIKLNEGKLHEIASNMGLNTTQAAVNIGLIEKHSAEKEEVAQRIENAYWDQFSERLDSLMKMGNLVGIEELCKEYGVPFTEGNKGYLQMGRLVKNASPLIHY